MFALEIEFLTGRAVATARHNREQAEWPPHPDRLFSALVDALHQAELTEAEQAAGRHALLWLEQLPPPAIAVSDAQPRDVIQAFVPVNDASVPDVRPGRMPSAGQVAAANAVLPEGRGKQARFFPTVVPEQPVQWFVWPDAAGAETHRPALERLAGCVPYLGHSSSLVRVAVADDPGPIRYEPAADGRHTFRVPVRGRLDELERDYRRQARPSPGTYASYRRTPARPEPPPRLPAESVFGDALVCQLGRGPFLPLTGAVKLMAAVRKAMIEVTDDATPVVKGLVSGHTADGGFSKADHIAYMPLPFIGHRHADGKIMGFALVLPRALPRFSEERRAVLRALVSITEVGFDGRSWNLNLVTAGEGPSSLWLGPYVGASRRWATVTPLLGDRFPKNRAGQRIEDVVARSIQLVVGVQPVRVEVGTISRVQGVPPSHAFAWQRKIGDVARNRFHACVEFDRPVRGPLLAGAGRFLGLGCFRSLDSNREGRR